MPSPDVAAYLGLTLVDTDAQTLLDTALANLALSFPDWTPREGNTELVLLEELAAMVEDDVYAINALPDGLTEALLRLFGLTRDQGAPPAADVRFTLTDTAGYTIPQGTTVRLNLGDNVDPVDLITSADLVIAPGDTTGVIGASGAEAVLEANGKPAGTALELLDALTFVNTVTLDTAASGGRLAEDGAMFLDRGIPLLSRLTTTLVRPVEIEAYVAEFPDVVRVKVLDLYNPGDEDSAPGRSPGYVTVAVAGVGGSSIGATAREVIAANLRTRMHAGLVVNVVDADVTALNYTVTLIRLNGYTAEEVEDNVRAAVAAYLNPDTWPWAKIAYTSELTVYLDNNAAGVDVITGVILGDFVFVNPVLPGYAPLADVGTVTVTVTDPA